MTDKQHLFSGSIPENYERYFVPLIFADYAVKLAELLDVKTNMKVLETACGTGIVTRQIIDKLGHKAEFIATDFNEHMLNQALRTIDPDAAVQFQQADATALPFSDSYFDAVLCQFGVMFFPNRLNGYREAARVLKSGGKFHFSVWDGLEFNGFANAIHTSVARLYPSDPPRFLKLPFGYFDIRSIVAELQVAGFSRVDVSVLPLESHAETARHIVLGFIAGGPLANEIMVREEPDFETAIEAVEKGIRKQFGEGQCRAKMQAIQFTAHLS